MKPATIIGLILIVLGIVGFSLGGFNFTEHKKDVDVGPVQIGHEKNHSVPIPPAVSTIVLIAGLGLVFVGVRGR